MARLFRFVGLVALLLAATGCSSQKFYPVRGQIVFPDGKPVTGLEGGSVIFEGTAADGKSFSAAGAIGADGRFELTTERPGDGAVAGKNRVMIQPQIVAPDKPPRRVILATYDSVTTSGIEIEVKPESNDVRITVEPVAGKGGKD